MNRFIKVGLIAASGIGIAYALNKMSDELEAQKAETQAALKSAETKYNQLQAAASTATPATSDNFVILPRLIWQNLSGSTGDTTENKQALLAWILNNVPQECEFTGIYKPDSLRSIRGYKYITDRDLTKCYIGVEEFSIFTPGLITTFGIKKGVYFEEQIGG